MNNRYVIVEYENITMKKGYFLSKESLEQTAQFIEKPENATTYGTFALAEKVKREIMKYPKYAHSDNYTIEIEEYPTAFKSEPPPPSEQKDETKAPSEPLSDVPAEQGLNWSPRHVAFNIAFEIAIKDGIFFYRYKDGNGKIRAQQRNGKDVVIAFCRYLADYLCRRIDDAERKTKM